MESLDENKENLIFKFSRKDNLFELNMLYSKDSLDTQLVKVLTESIMKITEKSLDDINVNIGEIGLISDENKQKIELFNDTEVDYGNKLILDLFEEISLRCKDNIALEFNDLSITYRELNEKANNFASYLIREGVASNKIVAVSLKRGLNQIIAILGIMKAGGAYLPLDVEYPEERVKYILDDSKASFLITEDNALDIYSSEQLNVINLLNVKIKEEVKKNVNEVKDKNDLAYVIYTSGTTGKPKGVMVCHESIANSLLWRINEYKLNSQDVTMQLFSYIFDGFITSFFTALLSGAKVIIIDEWTSINPKAVAKVINEKAVTNMIVVPTMYESILNYSGEGDLNTLRLVTLAGEKVTKSLVELSKEKLCETELNNEYGPTENSVVTTIKRDLNVNDEITIGKPIANTRVHILDGFGNEVPIGIEGEICLSGKGLSKGYLNRKDLNKEKFEENVLNEDRLYHTSYYHRCMVNGYTY